MFCMNCGQLLPDGAKFCLSCGTPQGAVTPSAGQAPNPINLGGTHTFVPAMCPNCSAHMQVDSSSKIARCESCGTECLVQDAIKTLNVQGNIQVGNATINVNGTNTENLLQRVEIMLASGDFDGAISKCDTILDSDPTNSLVYLYMLMANLKCRSRSELAFQNIPFNSNPYFVNAMQYGDNKLKDELIGYLNSAVERNRAEAAAELARCEAKIRSLRKGDEFTFGTFNGYQVYWKVLRLSGRKAQIITCQSLCNMPYHQPGGVVSWKSCTLRQWLNADFFNNSFTPTEKNRILSYATKKQALNPSDDRVALLDVNDMTHCFGHAQDRATGYPWWLKAPNSLSHYAIIVNENGFIPSEGVFSGPLNTSAACGVRPAMWISLE